MYSTIIQYSSSNLVVQQVPMSSAVSCKDVLHNICTLMGHGLAERGVLESVQRTLVDLVETADVSEHRGSDT